MSNFGSFSGGGGVKLTSTTANQTFTFPAGYGSAVIYNGATGSVWVNWNAVATVPSGTWANGQTLIPPGATVAISAPSNGATLNYIADVSGGELSINGGEGY